MVGGRGIRPVGSAFSGGMHGMLSHGADAAAAGKNPCIPRIGTMNHLTDVLRVLDDALQLQGRSASFNADTPLLGALPELDSMAVLAVVNGLETHFGIAFTDDQLSGASFATVGSLCQLVAESVDGTAT